MKHLFLLIALVFSVTLFAQNEKDIQGLLSERNELLDEFIQKGIKKWKPPGLAVTVVKDGEIVFTKTYGVTNIDNGKPVNSNTLFGCMSTTKAFVAAGLAILVDDGKLSWEDKVIDHLPDFQLKDPYITREINIIDLLTHRTGMGNTDYLWGYMNMSSDSVLYHMRDVEKSYSLRSGFIYQNIFYLAAGKVIEKVSGKNWGEFLKERIYDPLGMTNTHATLGEISEIENKAEGHYEFDGKITATNQLSADAIGPAGSMWSTIDDAGKWIRFLLNDGVVKQDTLITPKNFNMLFNTHQIVPQKEFYPTQSVTKPNFRTYGLGWFQHDYNGKMVQFHTGSLPGMVAIAGMIPEDEVGVYVMGNLDHVELRHAIMYAVFDIYDEGTLSRDWSEELYSLYHPETKKKEEPEPVPNTVPDFKQEDMYGVYYSSYLGGRFIGKDLMKITVQSEEGQLRFGFNDMYLGDLKHWHYNTYQATFDDKRMGKMLMNFRLNTNGKLSHIDIGGDRFMKK